MFYCSNKEGDIETHINTYYSYECDPIAGSETPNINNYGKKRSNQAFVHKYSER